MAIASLGTTTGTVTSFDADAGLGVIAANGQDYAFHCTAMADGSRTIEVDTAVAFEIIAGRMGQWEAWSIARQR